MRACVSCQSRVSQGTFLTISPQPFFGSAISPLPFFGPAISPRSFFGTRQTGRGKKKREEVKKTGRGKKNGKRSKKKMTKMVRSRPTAGARSSRPVGP